MADDWFARSIGNAGSPFGSFGAMVAPASPFAARNPLGPQPPGGFGSFGTPYGATPPGGFGSFGTPYGATPPGGFGSFGGGLDAGLENPIARFERQAAADLARFSGAPTGAPGGGGSAIPVGGGWAATDPFVGAYNAAAASTGVPANLIRSVHNAESSGTGRNVRPLRGEYVYGFNGIFQSTAADHGIDWNRMLQDDDYAIWAIGRVMQGIAGWSDPAGSGQTILQRYGWEGVATVYFGGKGALMGGFVDEDGKSSSWYGNQVITNWKNLEAMGSGAAGAGGGIYEGVAPGAGVGNPTGNAFLQEAQQYVGVKYVLGAIPGINEDPWVTGWDCSGFTYYLDQKYGTGQLPQGSHYQYDYAVRTGQLNTDPNRMRPGDLVFLDTGWQGGAGAHLNRAGHVGVYLGNGKMLHAANAQQGTVISDIAPYMGGFLGSMSMSWSGGAAGYAPPGGSFSSYFPAQQPAGSGTLWFQQPLPTILGYGR